LSNEAAGEKLCSEFAFGAQAQPVLREMKRVRSQVEGQVIQTHSKTEEGLFRLSQVEDEVIQSRSKTDEGLSLMKMLSSEVRELIQSFSALIPDSKYCVGSRISYRPTESIG